MLTSVFHSSASFCSHLRDVFSRNDIQHQYVFFLDNFKQASQGQLNEQRNSHFNLRRVKPPNAPICTEKETVPVRLNFMNLCENLKVGWIFWFAVQGQAEFMRLTHWLVFSTDKCSNNRNFLSLSFEDIATFQAEQCVICLLD